MFLLRSWTVVWLSLLPGTGWAEDLTESPSTTEESLRWASLLRLEATTLTLLPRQDAGRDEGVRKI